MGQQKKKKKVGRKKAERGKGFSSERTGAIHSRKIYILLQKKRNKKIFCTVFEFLK